MLGALCTRWTVLWESVPNVGLIIEYSKVVLTEYSTIPQMERCPYASNKSFSWGVTKLIWRGIYYNYETIKYYKTLTYIEVL